MARFFEWATQIAHGLAAAHEHGIVHRDLKPENVFVTQNGRVKILDFGLARLGVGHDGPVGTTLTMTEVGVTLGTAGYMAPEQVRGKPVDARADLFSFGCLLYEMLAGKWAFLGETPVEVMSAILSQEPQPLTVLRAEVPAPLERLVRHCLEKDPSLRIQCARDLGTYLDDVASLAGAAAPIIPSGPTRLRWRWAIPLVTLLLGALVTGLQV